MRVDPSLVRSGQWWDHKVPPLVAAAALTVLPATDPGGRGLIRDLVLFIVAAIGVAAFGHVVNDLADIRTDELAGKPNQLAGLSGGTQTAIVVATLAAGLLPWIWLPTSPAVWTLLAAEVMLLVVYSVRPIRLKDRSSAGVAADALYAYVVPVLLTIAVFTEVTGAERPSWLLLGAVTAWMSLMGLRGILWHQIGDLAHDRRAGVHTLATRIGAENGTRILGAVVVVELLAAAVSIAAVADATEAPWLVVLFAGYLVYRVFQMSLLWSEPVRPAAYRSPVGRVRFLGFVLLNEFVEKWLPVAALVALALRDPVLWFAVALHVVLFDDAATEFLRKDLPELPDAANRLAHERKSRQHIRRAAELRLAATAAGPMPVSYEALTQRRWVFVVCGPELHVDTLRTAVEHLRPLTSLEIWVVTDSSRNVHQIDHTGIDTVVDVATPPEMDDHQASIWLKTSVHRRLPPGEWCYLDSDIIAVRPGIEEIFDHRSGPVAFASDLTISVNQVDRFSPWAMNCECAGVGDVHSCAHLREQLKERIGVDVPGDWVHWNGGVFVFGEDSHDFLDLWHRTAIESFDWPEWRTRDQGALIATAWATGQQDCPRLPPEFNFIADLGNGDLCLDPDSGWALHPQGPWHQARLLHLYTSRLEDPEWDLGRDVEAPVIRQTLVRSQRWRRYQIRHRLMRRLHGRWYTAAQWVRDAYWASRERLGLYRLRLRRQVRRLHPSRMSAGVRRRLGQDVSPPDGHPGVDEAPHGPGGAALAGSRAGEGTDDAASA